MGKKRDVFTNLGDALSLTDAQVKGVRNLADDVGKVVQVGVEVGTRFVGAGVMAIGVFVREIGRK